jgi:hypothetical protein
MNNLTLRDIVASMIMLLTLIHFSLRGQRAMTKIGKRELLDAIRPRYVRASKAEKGRILNEFVATTGYHRKYAIRLLRHGPPRRPAGRRRGHRTYTPAVIHALTQVWEVCDGICSRRLHPFLPELLEALERHHELVLPAETKTLLLRMSRATMDRLLKPARVRRPRRGLSTTKPGTLLKKAIPVRTFADWEDARPGFLELDLVAHGGESTSGEFLYTLDTVDVASGWSECVAVPNRGQQAVFQAVQLIRSRLPFPLLGIDSDNDSAFINDHLYRYTQREHITFTRSRPYKKNDQAHIEQKNWSIVRRLIGYDRYDSAQAVACFNALYEELRLYVNFFQPSLKLLEKHRVDNKVHKTYDAAKTPYQRLLQSSDVSEANKDALRQAYANLNPVALRRDIDARLSALWDSAVGKHAL